MCAVRILGATTHSQCFVHKTKSLSLLTLVIREERSCRIEEKAVLKRGDVWLVKKSCPCSQEQECGQCSITPRAVNLFSRWETLLFLSSCSSFMLKRLSGSSSTPTAAQKNLSAPGIEPGTSGSATRYSDY
jgi:hypothetical protein